MEHIKHILNIANDSAVLAKAKGLSQAPRSGDPSSSLREEQGQSNSAAKPGATQPEPLEKGGATDVSAGPAPARAQPAATAVPEMSPAHSQVPLSTSPNGNVHRTGVYDAQPSKTGDVDKPSAPANHETVPEPGSNGLVKHQPSDAPVGTASVRKDRPDSPASVILQKNPSATPLTGGLSGGNTGDVAADAVKSTPGADSTIRPSAGKNPSSRPSQHSSAASAVFDLTGDDTPSPEPNVTAPRNDAASKPAALRRLPPNLLPPRSASQPQATSSTATQAAPKRSTSPVQHLHLSALHEQQRRIWEQQRQQAQQRAAQNNATHHPGSYGQPAQQRAAQNNAAHHPASHGQPQTMYGYAGPGLGVMPMPHAASTQGLDRPQPSAAPIPSGGRALPPSLLGSANGYGQVPQNPPSSQPLLGSSHLNPFSAAFGAQPNQVKPQSPLADTLAMLAAAVRRPLEHVMQPGSFGSAVASAFKPHGPPPGQPDPLLQPVQRPYEAALAARTLPPSLRSAPAPTPSSAPPAVRSPETGEAVEAVIEALSACDNAPSYPPSGTLTINIMPHQAKALGWMKAREAGTKLPVGGILADDQGLGKTVTTIALLVSNTCEPTRTWSRIKTDLSGGADAGRPPAKRPRGRASAEASGADAARGADGRGARAGSDDDAELLCESGPALGGVAPKSEGAGGSKDAGSTPGSTDGAAGSTDGGCGVAQGGVVPKKEGEGGLGAVKSEAAQGNAASLPAAKRESDSRVCVIDSDDEDGGGAAPQGAAASGSAAGPSMANSARDDLPHAGTLIVAPTSLLAQWEQEIKAKVDPSQRINVLLYHGKNKDSVTSAQRLAAYSVVITSYTLVANECRSIIIKLPKGDGEHPIDLISDDEDEEEQPAAKDKNGKAKRKRKRSSQDGLLFHVNWHRVVLDEGQMIKNARTKVAQAAWQLRATHRWILSGTPIQNGVADLYSYFRFLQWRPFNTAALFKQHIAEPIKQRPERGFKKLQGILQGVLLRRTKASKIDGKPIIEIPPCKQTLSSMEFMGDERAFYEHVEAEGKKVIAELRAGENRQEAYFHALAHLMRLRQACCHPHLVKRFVRSKAQESVSPDELRAASFLQEETRAMLLHRLTQPERHSCARCDDIPDDPVASSCGHLFCRTCSVALMEGVDSVVPCPGCSALLQPNEIHSAAALLKTADHALPPHVREYFESPAGAAGDNWKSSTKITRLLEVLKEIHASNDARPDSKEASTSGPPATVTVRASFAGRSTASSSFFKAALSSKKPPPSSAADRLKAADARKAPARVAAEKSVVFSQFTGFLDLVEPALERQGYKFRRVDGRMTLAQRELQLAEFKSDPSVTVLLLSLRAASLGLNLVVANHVVLLDLWWNPTVEDQAIDRTHRIGQTRVVKVTRITIRDTVEDRILQLQEKKRQIVNAAFGESAGNAGAHLTRDDLLYLFGA